MNFRSSCHLSAIVVCMFAWTNMVRKVEAVPVTSDPPPVTSGLIVELNGENLSAGVLSIWTDQASSGAGTFQNYVQGTAGNQPSVSAGFAMPNTLTSNVVTFARGSTSGSGSSQTNSDYLRSVQNGADASTTAGADAAYQLTQVTYFTVFNSTLGGTTADNRQRQIAFVANYSSGGTNATLITQTNQSGFDANGAAVAASGLTDLYVAARNIGGGQEGAGVPNMPTSRWYISANSWDTVSGAFRMLLFDELGNVVDRSLPNIYAGALSTHTMSALGAFPNPTAVATTSGQALTGNIAEFLMYDTALGTGAVNQVVNYLNNKYFGAATVLPVPEVSSFLLVGMSFLVGGGAWAVRRGMAKQSSVN
ncbi:MAG: hypothetical protein WD468_08060 [Pirellulales bacterium]